MVHFSVLALPSSATSTWYMVEKKFNLASPAKNKFLRDRIRLRAYFVRVFFFSSSFTRLISVDENCFRFIYPIRELFANGIFVCKSNFDIFACCVWAYMCVWNANINVQLLRADASGKPIKPIVTSQATTPDRNLRVPEDIGELSDTHKQLLFGVVPVSKPILKAKKIVIYVCAADPEGMYVLL